MCNRHSQSGKFNKQPIAKSIPVSHSEVVFTVITCQCILWTDTHTHTQPALHNRSRLCDNITFYRVHRLMLR